MIFFFEICPWGLHKLRSRFLFFGVGWGGGAFHKYRPKYTQHINAIVGIINIHVQ